MTEKAIKLELYPRYSISEDGTITNTENNKVLSGGINGSGYRHYRLKGIDGKTQTVGEHRLIAMVYHGIPENHQSMVVNHLDGVKLNNDATNVEWTTYQGNAEHAGRHGLTEKCIPIQTKCVFTDVVREYPSYIAAAKELGISKDAISWRVNAGEDKVDNLNLQYRKSRQDINWTYPAIWDKALLVKNALTGEVKEYSEQSELCKEYGVSPAFVSTNKMRINQPLIALGDELFQIIPYTPEPKWIDHGDPYVAYEKNCNRRCVVLYRPDTEDKRIFLSVLSAAETYGFKKSTIRQRLTANKTTPWFDGFICHYLFKK